MTTTPRRATTVATLALSAALTSGPLLAAGTAHADDTSTTTSKAAIEHDERLAAGSASSTSASTGQLTKAQIEHREAADRSASTGTTSTGSTTSVDGGTGQPGATGGDAAAWQLAMAAALGALVTGAAFVGARQVAAHRPSGQAVTS